VFVATTIVIFCFSLSTAESVGLVPCYVDGTECLPFGALAQEGNAYASVGTFAGPFDANREVLALSDLPELGPVETAEIVKTELPTQISIPEIDLDLPIQNAPTRDIEELDQYLKKGPVRYVDSARLGESGNVLIFAHTSHLPVVRNQMYKAFNRVPELKPGDSITISGEDHSYLYTVRSLRSADASEDVIDLSPVGKTLTLVTCDTLTGKSARFILEADFVAKF
jgi:LPXTG-site transpeptidase (sortase) family protein